MIFNQKENKRLLRQLRLDFLNAGCGAPATAKVPSGESKGHPAVESVAFMPRSTRMCPLEGGLLPLAAGAGTVPYQLY
jgi:hypothetical protein